MMNTLGLSDLYNNSTMFKYAFNIVAVDLLAMFPAFGIAALILKRNFTSEFFPAKRLEN